MRPWTSGFELRAHPDHGRFVPRPADELHADGEAELVEAGGHRRRGLARRVPHARERREHEDLLDLREVEVLERADERRRLADRRGEQQVVVVEERNDLTRTLLEVAHAPHVVARGDAPSHLEQHPVPGIERRRIGQVCLTRREVAGEDDAPPGRGTPRRTTGARPRRARGPSRSAASRCRAQPGGLPARSRPPRIQDADGTRCAASQGRLRPPRGTGEPAGSPSARHPSRSPASRRAARRCRRRCGRSAR